MKRGINRLIVLNVVFHISPHRDVSKMGLNDGELLAVNLSGDLTLLKDSEALI
jgi:hypothetical protein